MPARRIIATFAAVFAVLAVTVAAPVAGAKTNLHIALLKGTAPTASVSGKVKFAVDDGARRIEAEVEHANSLRGVRLTFRIDGAVVGSAVVDSLGTARLRISGSAIPAVHTGSSAVVRRAATGALVATGTFN
jgi:hypothetical protein